MSSNAIPTGTSTARGSSREAARCRGTVRATSIEDRCPLLLTLDLNRLPEVDVKAHSLTHRHCLQGQRRTILDPELREAHRTIHDLHTTIAHRYWDCPACDRVTGLQHRRLCTKFLH